MGAQNYIALPSFERICGPVPGIGAIIDVVVFDGIVYASRAREDGQGNDIYQSVNGKWELVEL